MYTHTHIYIYIHTGARLYSRGGKGRRECHRALSTRHQPLCHGLLGIHHISTICTVYTNICLHTNYCVDYLRTSTRHQPLCHGLLGIHHISTIDTVYIIHYIFTKYTVSPLYIRVRSIHREYSIYTVCTIECIQRETKAGQTRLEQGRLA